MTTPTTIPSRRIVPKGDKEDSHLHWGMRAGSVGVSDPPGPVCLVPGLPPWGSPPSLPGPLCLLSQGTPHHDHHLPGRPDLDIAVSSSWPFPLPSLPSVNVLTLASVSSGRMGPDWELSLWKRVSVGEEKAQEKHHSLPAKFPMQPSGSCRPQPGWKRQKKARIE